MNTAEWKLISNCAMCFAQWSSSPKATRTAQLSNMATLVCRSLRLLSRRFPRDKICQIPQRTLPVCTVQTNVSQADISPDLSKKLSKFIADTLNKPENLVTVSVQTDLTVCNNGKTSETFAIVQLWSIGVFDEQRNPGYSKKLFEFLPEELGIPANRLSVLLHPIAPHDAAHRLYAQMNNGQ